MKKLLLASAFALAIAPAAMAGVGASAGSAATAGTLGTAGSISVGGVVSSANSFAAGVESNTATDSASTKVSGTWLNPTVTATNTATVTPYQNLTSINSTKGAGLAVGGIAGSSLGTASGFAIVP